MGPLNQMQETPTSCVFAPMGLFIWGECNDFDYFCPISELEAGEGVSAYPRAEAKRDKKKAERSEATAPPSDRRGSPLHVEDLDDPPLSPVPDSTSSVDE